MALQADIEGRALLPLSDRQILSLMAAMKPDAFVEYARSGMIPNNTYEYRMRRQERISGHWPERADHVDIRYEDTPRKVYARWLPDGQHAGQEILYDETRAPDTLLGHPGGPLRIISAEIPIDSIFARAQSRHSVRDFGLQFVTRTIEHDARSFREEGLSEKPAHVEIITMNGIRLLAWTWSATSGPPNHYAQTVRLLFDLVHTWPCDEIAWNERGELLERIHFEDIEPRSWDATSFSRHNPDFGFD
ncbi:DUF1571 domain-containing protein [Paraburkholderia sp. J67]|uniref:DUF1571 domain-containing protein n=1 Tax=Paraburkholderia sp. J67 TaxID=2805435 RepID=UPI002ABE81F0|nr:DUF1571 domain-containing protein [Paraburkholderia sp. J67]